MIDDFQFSSLPKHKSTSLSRDRVRSRLTVRNIIPKTHQFFAESQQELQEIRRSLAFIGFIVSFILLFISFRAAGIIIFLSLLFLVKYYVIEHRKGLSFTLIFFNISLKQIATHSDQYIQQILVFSALGLLFLSVPFLLRSVLLGYMFFTFGLFVLGTYFLFKHIQKNIQF